MRCEIFMILEGHYVATYLLIVCQRLACVAPDQLHVRALLMWQIRVLTKLEKKSNISASVLYRSIMNNLQLQPIIKKGRFDLCIGRNIRKKKAIYLQILFLCPFDY